MSFVFTQRSLQQEQMDRCLLDAMTADHVWRNLETINRWLGGVRPTLRHLKHFSKRWKPGEPIRLLDWGTGGADMLRAIVRWGRTQGFRIEALGIDQDPVSVRYAQEACRDYSEITIAAADAATYDAPAQHFDYVLSSLTLHHLSDETIVQFLKRSDRWARRGLIMNDLQRSSRAWAWIWLLSRVARAHPMVRHDGPLSVKRAFVPRELTGYARQAGLPYLTVARHFGYRLTLAGEKS